MSNKNKSTRIIFKKIIYIVQLGTLYIWDTASSTRCGCVDRALKYFNINDEEGLAKKGAEIILISTKEVK
jgi:hypothetical protein